MRHIFLRLFTVFFCVILLVSCGSSENELYNQLKEQIEIINSKMNEKSMAPVAVFNDLVLVEDTLIYKATALPQDEPPGINLNDIYKKYPDIIRDRNKNAIALSFSTHPEIKDLMPVVLNSLNLFYKSELRLLDGSILEIKFTSQEIRDLIKNGYDRKSYLREILRSDLFFANMIYPVVYDYDGNEISSKYFTKEYLKDNFDILETIFLENNRVVTLMSLCENEMTAEETAELYGTPEAKEIVISNQISEDPFFKDVVERCAIAGVDMEYRFNGAKTKKVANVIYPNSLLKRLSGLPKYFFDE